MRLHYPSETRFYPENFGNCCLEFIFQALEAIQEKELENANLIAIPLSNIGMAIASSNGAKDAKPEWFNPYQKVLDAKQKTSLLDCFNYLLNKGLIPCWVIPQVDFLD